MLAWGAHPKSRGQQRHGRSVETDLDFEPAPDQRIKPGAADR
jgi:hypothetical protein